MALGIDAELGDVVQSFVFGEPTLWRARIHAVLGDGDTAIRLARQAFAEGIGSRGWQVLHTSRDFDALRDDPGFVWMVGPQER